MKNFVPPDFDAKNLSDSHNICKRQFLIAAEVGKVTPTQNAARHNAVEKMWLQHYNNVLLEQGLITDEQYRRMCAQIATRQPAGKNEYEPEHK